MIPAASAGLPVANGGQLVSSTSGAAKPDSAVSGQANSSAGVTSPANAKPLTSEAVDPSRQAAIAPRLRDQDNTERTTRKEVDAPTGPPPAFEETPMQRASRVIFDPPEGYLEVNSPPVSDEASPKSTDDEAREPQAESSNSQAAARDNSSTEKQRKDSEEVAARQAEEAFQAARELAKSDRSDVDVSL